MSADMVNHPPHYSEHPDGLTAECIEYTRHMPFSQGNAFKYLYRAGAKGDPAEDLAKAAWYLRDAIDHGAGTPAFFVRGFPRIDPNPTHRARALHYIARGRLITALDALEQLGPRILNERGI